MSASTCCGSSTDPSRARLAAAGAAALLVAAVAACGGSSGTSSTPTSPTTTTGGGPTATAVTIAIGADGAVSPNAVTLARGGRVTFVNNHGRNHDMSSDPHPDHSDCPELNEVGFLRPGESRTSGNLNVARTCGFHDHGEPSNAALKGRITIQ